MSQLKTQVGIKSLSCQLPPRIPMYKLYHCRRLAITMMQLKFKEQPKSWKSFSSSIRTINKVIFQLPNPSMHASVKIFGQNGANIFVNHSSAEWNRQRFKPSKDTEWLVLSITLGYIFDCAIVVQYICSKQHILCIFTVELSWYDVWKILISTWVFLERDDGSTEKH